jgi:hypothetical protein
MSVTANHWYVHDVEKFKAFIKLVRDNVDLLIKMMGNEENVDRAVKHDIRALGWHPIFEKLKASSDSAKLRLIREACKDDYPEYSAVTDGALAYIDREWIENIEDVRKGGGGSMNPLTESPAIPAIRLIEKDTSPKERRPSLFNVFKKSWRKGSKDLTAAGRSGSIAVPPMDPQRSKSADDAGVRSMSVVAPSGPTLSPPLTPERSKSIGHVPMREPEVEEDIAPKPVEPVELVEPVSPDKSVDMNEEDGGDLTQIPTATSVDGVVINPVASMISRHDQWKPLY